MKWSRPEDRVSLSGQVALTATGILMMAALMIFSIGMVVDQRSIGGAPAWSKPAKFAFSTGLFCLTIAWLFRYLTVWRRFLGGLGWTISIALIIPIEFGTIRNRARPAMMRQDVSSYWN